MAQRQLLNAMLYKPAPLITSNHQNAAHQWHSRKPA
jgi:hypothetical protein